MAQLKDLEGHHFGRLHVLRRMGSDKFGEAMWLCLCECGNTLAIRGSSLRKGLTTSCGCYHAEKCTTHGMNKTPEHRAWRDMKARCAGTDAAKTNYPYHAGRGIPVCNEWINSFVNFYRDMGPKPSRKHTLDRINNDKGYSKDNCRWATVNQQTNNTRRNVKVSLNGATFNLKEWCQRKALNYNTVRSRIRRGWSAESALAIPSRYGKPCA